MKGTLRKTDDGWILEESDGTELDSGDWPLTEDAEFIEEAAEKLDNWNYHNRPYQVIDERSSGGPS